MHLGLGPLGVKVLNELLERRLFEVAAAVDINPELAGKPLATVCPKAPGDLKILAGLEQVKDWGAIGAAIVTTSSDLRACAPTFRELLKRGLPVVSTCEELLFPWLRHKALAQELDALAKQHGGRLLGTGVNPGFLMDALPVFATAVCRSVKAVGCYRFQDASSRRIPFQKKIGVGLDDEQFAARVRDGSLRHVGLGESLHFIAHYLGLTVERWEEDIAPVKAEREMVSGMGVVPRGRCAGVRQVARGYHDDREVVRLEFQAAIGQEDPYDRVVIEGEPGVDLVIQGGVHGDVATSAITLNSVGSLLGAAPGLHTMATIPMVRHAAVGR